MRKKSLIPKPSFESQNETTNQLKRNRNVGNKLELEREGEEEEGKRDKEGGREGEEEEKFLEVV